MKIDTSQPIAKFAAGIPGAIGVFETLGIDYASLSDRSLEDAAHAEGIAPDVVIGALRRLGTVSKGETWNDRPLGELTHHLVQQHHHFVRHELGRSAMLLSDVCEQDEVLTDLMSLRAAFIRLAEVLLPHLSHEETGIFRAIEAMEKEWQSGERVVPPADLSASLRQLAAEHGVISAQLHTIRELRLRLAGDNDLPLRCKALLDDLAKLEAHLHEYMFLENWIVFPRAAALAEQPPEPAVTRP